MAEGHVSHRWTYISCTWHSNLINSEKNVDDVLQSENIFINVSKGELAKAGDLKSAFKGMDDRKIALEV